MPWAVYAEDLEDKILDQPPDPQSECITGACYSSLERSIETSGGIVKGKLRGYMNMSDHKKVSYAAVSITEIVAYIRCNQRSKSDGWASMDSDTRNSFVLQDRHLQQRVLDLAPEWKQFCANLTNGEYLEKLAARLGMAGPVKQEHAKLELGAEEHVKLELGAETPKVVQPATPAPELGAETPKVVQPATPALGEQTPEGLPTPPTSPTLPTSHTAVAAGSATPVVNERRRFRQRLRPGLRSIAKPVETPQNPDAPESSRSSSWRTSSKKQRIRLTLGCLQCFVSNNGFRFGCPQSEIKVTPK